MMLKFLYCRVLKGYSTALFFIACSLVFLFAGCKEDPEPRAVFKAKVDGVDWESTKDYPMLVVVSSDAIEPSLKGSVVENDSRVVSEIHIILNAGIAEKTYTGSQAELFFYEDDFRKSWKATAGYTFVIQKYKDNRVSGYFSFTATNSSPNPTRIITEGVFENVPIVEKQLPN